MEQSCMGATRRNRPPRRLVFCSLQVLSLLGVAFASGCWPDTTAHPVGLGGTAECYSCHQTDYEQATNPPHVDNFPTTCEQCHGTQSFRPALVGVHPEDAFRIQAGPHQGLDCASCHRAELGPFGAGNTDCVGCHLQTHARSAMDLRHSGVPGYPSGEAAGNFCLGCHPNGEQEGGASHPEERFSLQGQHAPFGCADCHDANLGPNGAGNTDCVGCHVGAHGRALTDPLHQSVAGYPAGDAAGNFCLGCHPAGTVDRAALSHPEDRFPLTDGHILGCGDCHDAELGPNGAANTDCVGCHLSTHALGVVQGQHSEVAGFPANPMTGNFCLGCHPSGQN